MFIINSPMAAVTCTGTLRSVTNNISRRLLPISKQRRTGTEVQSWV
ncbi:17.7g5 protein [Bracoviriform inaniti]|uniref:17.7g5 protein n=1 Tax=Bracoviriform inaniti TaxID=36344 RepID=A8E107_9VIRU|nr:17.7g5 protein [Bracoviriform inaniti]CAO98977.1 17.7g5 protein [Bracoviriform inaniti]